MTLSLRFLFDEHMPRSVVRALRQLEPTIECVRVGDEGVPPRGTPDPDIIVWCEANGFVLVTNNRASMPVHLAEHLARGGHLPGVFTIKKEMSPGQLAEELLIVAVCSRPDEYRDRIEYLPIS